MSDRKISEAILQLAGLQLKDALGMVVASVQSVDVDNRTCDVLAVTGTATGIITGVQLMASIDDGLLYVPAIDSTVIIMYSIKNLPFIAMYSELTAIYFDVGSSTITVTDGLIQFNDGLLGGITNTLELKTQLEKTNQLLTSLLNVINGAPIPEPGNSAPSALQAALQLAISGQSLGTYENIEDTKIIH